MDEFRGLDKIMYHFSIEFLELAVSCLGFGEGKVVYSDRAGYGILIFTFIFYFILIQI